MFWAFKFSLYVNVLPYFGYFYENWAKLCAVLWSRWPHLMLSVAFTTIRRLAECHSSGPVMVTLVD